MRPRLRLRSAPALLALLALPALPAAAQDDGDGWVERCRRNDNGWQQNRATHCEVRETRMRADGSLRVDGRENGGVEVVGWDRDEVLVQARVQASAPARADAEAMARAIRVETGGGTVRAQGPQAGNRRNWSVSYRVFVPRRTDLNVDTRNGPISVRDVSGRMALEAHNGPLTLRNVGGEVRGRTHNGPLTAALSGSRWNGAGLDLETHNGPVTLSIPDGYSARLETGNVNGPMTVDFPVTVQGRLGRRINTTLGNGGATIRAITTNGPVTVRRS